MFLFFKFRPRTLFLAVFFSVLSAPLMAAEVCSTSTYNTCIQWNDSLHGAAVNAAEQDKLLLILHLSGNFTKTEFT